ncbi:nucleotidyltransferase family protein [Zavarzinia compransoris]|uniref:Mannose-1-phosphate guanylyltransferase n=1 Tax=Zavarzinia compransoris TaxID=1264899 RepID=A0A317E0B8_9PROT|nr:nucleotidyltransferase family protein [Zavarzinia compransoris]PWR19576.1 mannose-1-phosphate guanylyltransferase [Zavarzinia compransoris]TDP40440.1 MurNAc alpha-1-phosphate uridylyltransferase [Zavarzinia compransoris]
MTTTIDTAMVLAAGKGMRMRPLTDRLPKPLVRVDGRSLLDRLLDRLAAAGIRRAVVNVHHLADQIEARLAARRAEGQGPETLVSDERGDLLETGGGVARALPLLGPAPFLVCNADTFWLQGVQAPLAAMIAAFDPARMDALLLLAPTVTAIGLEGFGDFLMAADGGLTRRPELEVAPFVYAGCAIMTPAAFTDLPPGAFSLNLLWDRAIGTGRLFGHRLDGQFLHVGTIPAIAEAEAALAGAL